MLYMRASLHMSARVYKIGCKGTTILGHKCGIIDRIWANIAHFAKYSSQNVHFYAKNIKKPAAVEATD